jgi:hypothetical protein
MHAGKGVGMGNLTINIGFLVKTPKVGENHPIGARFVFYRNINAAMELTAPGL